MTTEKPRFMLATVAVLAVVGLQSLAAAQERKVVPGNVIKAAKPVPVERAHSPASLGIHGFSVVLVVAGPRGTTGTDPNVPGAARKALADMKDFLPYQRYELLDAAWILCCASNTSQVSGRVRGPDGRDYLYTVDPGDIAGSKLNVRFVMREYGDSAAVAGLNLDRMSDTARLEFVRQRAEAVREVDEAEIQFRSTQQKFQVGTATASEMESATARVRRAQQRAQELERMAGGGQARGSSAQAAGAAQAGAGGRGGGGARAGGTTANREIMDSSFSISPGETVVIGTSRINGDQALIAILTAATKPGAGR